MLTRVFVLLVAGVLLFAGAGCGSSAQKGAEKDKDMPKSAEKDT